MFYTFGFIMEKDLRYIELFELYQGLLTDRQRELFSSHYYYDLSLSEIAEPDGNTRQSVYAAVKKVKNKLDEYENLLHLKQKYDSLKGVSKNLSTIDKKSSQEILDIIGE
ncbi:MAG: hypothetical protein IJA88_01265 [Clostridia bacterium]|nr:hypothetical protein [Clostridia bacterium]